MIHGTRVGCHLPRKLPWTVVFRGAQTSLSLFEVANLRFPAGFLSPNRQRGTKETFNFPTLTFRARKKRNLRTPALGDLRAPVFLFNPENQEIRSNFFAALLPCLFV